MFEFIRQNAGSLAVGAILLAVITLIVISIIRGKRSGKGSCGGDCAHCGCCSKKKIR